MNISFNKKIRVFICMFFLLTTFSNVNAATGVPSTLSYQGRLTDSGGNPLGAGGTTYYFKFSLWDSATPATGNKLWPTSSPSSTSLTVRQGSFSVDIGDTDNGYPDVLDYDFNTNKKIYLQVEVSGDNSTFETLAPRSSISAAAFSQVASQVNGIGQSSFGTTTPFLNTVISAISTSINSAVMSIKGIAGQVANLFNIFDSSGNTLFTVGPSGNVGVGTSTPIAKLDVWGSLNVATGTTPTLFVNTATGMVGIGTATPSFGKMHIFGNVGGNSLYLDSNSGLNLLSIKANANGQAATVYTVGSSQWSVGSDYTDGTGTFKFNTSAYPSGASALFAITRNGNVGVGTSTPNTKLDVWGSLNVATGTTPTLFVNTATGNVGIGTATPAAGLDIFVPAGTLPFKFTQNASGGTPALAQFADSSGVLAVLGANTYGSTRAFQMGASAGKSLGLYSNNSYAAPQLYIDSTGNIGIGTTTPTGKLEIVSNSATTKALVLKPYTGSSVSTLEIQNASGAVVAAVGVTGNLSAGNIGSYSGQISGLLASVSAPTFSFNTDLDTGMWSSGANTLNFSTGASEKLRIDASGNVGIGTTTPSAKLAITGTAGSGDIFAIASSTDARLLTVTGAGRLGIGAIPNEAGANRPLLQIVGNQGLGQLLLSSSNTDSTSKTSAIQMGAYNNSWVSYAMFYGQSTASQNILSLGGGLSGSASASQLDFYTDSTQYSGTGGNLRMRIDTNGNVGIGTTTPSVKLDVWGSLNVATGTTPTLFVNTATGNVGIGTASPTSSFGRSLEILGSGSAGLSLSNGGKKFTFGVTGTNSLGFYDETLSTYRLLINSTGNVGINTSTPTAGTLVVKNINDATLYQYQGINDNGNTNVLFTQNSAGDASYNLYKNGTALGSPEVQVHTNSSSWFNGGNVGIGTTTPTEKLSVIGNGQFTAVGSGAYAFDLNLTAEGTLTTSASDVNLKENILLIDSVTTLEKISQLKPSTFDWKSNKSHDIGLIAQEVELIFPELVFTNPTDGYKGINYSRFSTLLISAVQELTKKITSLFDGTAVVKVKELCIEDICITKDELQHILQNETVNTATPSAPVVVEDTNNEPIPEPVVNEPAVDEDPVVEEPVVDEPVPEPVTEEPVVESPTPEPVVEIPAPTPEPIIETTE